MTIPTNICPRRRLPGLPRPLRAAALLAALGGALAPLGASAAPTPDAARPLPRIVHQDGRYALSVDGAPFLMLGAQINNSSAWPAMMPRVWPAIDALHANTVEMPVYWEQMEAQPGRFDFSVVDTLLSQARAHHVRLVLLWFGTWKNGSAHYIPAWMKKQPALYPNVVTADGRPVDSPSPHAPAFLAADIHAFSALMGHLKTSDPQHTVIMVQVENEPGTWGAVRDFSPAAQRLFDGPVPARLLAALGKQPGTWREVFGDDADESFHAWSVGHYIGQVAAAGKAVNPLPMYVNVALRDPLTPGRPPAYESGGATDNVLSIWKAAAPAVDLLAPDIYQDDSARYRKAMDLYRRPDNALFIPETASRPQNARYFFAALGQGAIGFSPFGLDYTNFPAVPAAATPSVAAFAADYRAFAPMDREIARLNFAGRVRADAEEPDRTIQRYTFGAWEATVAYGSARTQSPPDTAPGNPQPTGRALLAQLGPDQFLVTGVDCHVFFRPTGPAAGKPWQFLRVEEGRYENDVFQPARIWNGDQTDWGLTFGATPVVLRVSLYTR